ncbi:MAG: Ig-like domain-containing protein [Dehalococcoidia bacterium]
MMRSLGVFRPRSIVLRRIIAVLALVALAGLPSPAQVQAATTWTVCPAGCNFATIALALANASVVNGDTIQLTAADYQESDLVVTKNLTFVGVGGTPTVGKASPPQKTVFQVNAPATRVQFQNLIIQNGLTGVNGEGAGINASSSLTALTLDGVTVRRNKINFASSNSVGAGIRAGGPLTLTNSIVVDNHAFAAGGLPVGFAAGGGIFAFGSSVYLSNTQILSNTLQGGDVVGGFNIDGGVVQGGGMSYVRSGAAGRLTILNSVIAGNVITGGISGNVGGNTGGNAQGGGLYVRSDGGFSLPVVIQGSRVSDNRATGGAGAPPSSGSGSSGGDVEGAGVYADFSVPLTMTSSIVSRNVATGGVGVAAVGPGSVGGSGGRGSGGGLRLGTTTAISATAIVSNSVTGAGGGAGATGPINGDGGTGGSGGDASGGGVILLSGLITVTNSTIASNQVVGGSGGTGGNEGSGAGDAGVGGPGGDAVGGGINIAGSVSAIRNSTISSNGTSAGAGGLPGSGSSPVSGSAGTASGGGVESFSLNLSILASVLSSNIAATGADLNGGATSQGGNVLSTAPIGFTAPNDRPSTNPLLGPLADNGGGTLTMALLPTSPAIGFAGNRACPTLDQRGQPRRVGLCDSGAYAVQPTSLEVVSGSGQSTLIGTSFGAPLVVRPLYGSAVLTGATVTFAGPLSGASATFGGQPQAVVTATNGLAQAQPAANLVVGSYQVSATAGAASPAAFSLTNLIRQTTTSISSGPNPSLVGAMVTVTASVTASGGTPGGTIAINADTGESCQVAAPGGSCTLTLNSLGVRTLTASYGGDTQHAQSSAQTSQVVTQSGGGTIVQTSTTVSTSPNPSVVGTPITVTASVLAPSGSPTGTITVTVDTGQNCQIAAPSGNCQLTLNTVGQRTVTANYSGGGVYTPSGAIVTHTVVQSDGPPPPPPPPGGQSQYLGLVFKSVES